MNAIRPNGDLLAEILPQKGAPESVIMNLHYRQLIMRNTVKIMGLFILR